MLSRSIPLLSLLFLTSIFYVNFVARVVFGPLLPVIESEMGLGYGAAGSLFLFLAFGYSAGLYSSGFVSWWLGYRRTIVFSALAVGLALLLVSLSRSLVALRLGLLLLGSMAGLYLPAGVATITDLVDRSHWGKGLATHELAPSFGFVTAPLLAEALLRAVSWRGVLAVVGLANIALGLLYEWRGRRSSLRGDPPHLATMLRLARNPGVLRMALLFVLTIGCAPGLYGILSLFLVVERGMTRPFANTLIGLSRLSAVPLLFVSGALGDRFGQGRVFTAFQAATGVFTICLGLIGSPPGATVLVVILQAAAAASAFPAGFALTALCVAPAQRHLAVSLVILTGTLLGAGGIPSAVGYLAQVSSFSVAIALVGLLALASPLLLRGLPTKREA